MLFGVMTSVLDCLELTPLLAELMNVVMLLDSLLVLLESLGHSLSVSDSSIWDRLKILLWWFFKMDWRPERENEGKERRKGYQWHHQWSLYIYHQFSGRLWCSFFRGDNGLIMDKEMKERKKKDLKIEMERNYESNCEGWE